MMKNSNHRKREKFLAGFTAVLILSALIYIAAVKPCIKACATRIDQIEKLKAELVMIRADMLVRDKIEERYEYIKSLLGDEGSNQQQISRFCSELNGMYEKLPLQVRSIKIMPVAEDKFCRKLSVKIEFTGHIKEIMKLISAVELSDSAIGLEQMEIKASQTTDVVGGTFLLSKIVNI